MLLGVTLEGGGWRAGGADMQPHGLAWMSPASTGRLLSSYRSRVFAVYTPRARAALPPGPRIHPRICTPTLTAAPQTHSPRASVGSLLRRPCVLPKPFCVPCNPHDRPHLTLSPSPALHPGLQPSVSLSLSLLPGVCRGLHLTGWRWSSSQLKCPLLGGLAQQGPRGAPGSSSGQGCRCFNKGL